MSIERDTDKATRERGIADDLPLGRRKVDDHRILENFHPFLPTLALRCDVDGDVHGTERHSGGGEHVRLEHVPITGEPIKLRHYRCSPCMVICEYCDNCIRRKPKNASAQPFC